MSVADRNLNTPGQTNAPTPPTDSTPTDPAADSGCCGGAASANIDACCARDAEAKAAGGSGCGCGCSTAS